MDPYEDEENAPSVAGTESGGSDMTEGAIDEEKWYNDEVMGLRLGPHEVAHKLLLETQNVLFSEARLALQVQKQEADDDMAARPRVRRTVHDTANRYFLTVIDGMVQVVYGAKMCGHFHATDEHLTVMMGDQCQIGQTVREPKFMRLLGTMAEQIEIFGGKAYADTHELDEIIEELEHFSNDATQVEQDDALDPVVTWRVLPVHPKVAILFLRGLPVLAAAKLVQAMVAQVQPEEEDDLYLLSNFCRVACTATEGEDGIEVAWTPVHPTETNQIFEWCQGLKMAYVPNPAPTVILPPMPPNPRAPEPGMWESEAGMERMMAAAMATSRVVAEIKVKTKRFSTMEIRRFAAVAGLDVAEDATASVMTPFFRGLEEHRGSKAASRSYVEEAMETAVSLDPTAQMDMTTIFSTDVITAIQDVDVTASDKLVRWDMRLKGQTIFNLAPTPDNLVEAAWSSRIHCMEYEVYDHSKHEDVKQAKTVHTAVEEWPLTPDRVRAWILTYRRHMITMYGNFLIIRPLLDRLLVAMRRELNWQTVDVIGCMTLTWGIHKGLRAALTPAPRGSMVYLRKVVVAFEEGDVPSLASVGEVIANRIRAVTAKPVVKNLGLGGAAQSGLAWNSGSQATGPQGPTKRQRTDYGTRISGPAFAQAWAGDVKAVETKIGQYFKGADFCRDQGKISAIFGSEFQALMPVENPNPCMSFFLLGRCHDKCHRSHTTTTPPNQQILEGIKKRVHAHSQQLLQPKNS
jgi:hypothetical protein